MRFRQSRPHAAHNAGLVRVGTADHAVADALWAPPGPYATRWRPRPVFSAVFLFPFFFFF